MEGSTVVELHASPPAYGEVACDPYCLAAHRVLSLSGVPYTTVHDASNGAAVPRMVVLGDTMSGTPHLNDLSGASPQEGFDAVVGFLLSCGAAQGPVHRHESLPPRKHGQAVALREFLERSLLPPLDWARSNKHSAAHRAQLAEHAGLLKRMALRGSYSITRSIAQLDARARQAAIRSDTDAVEVAMEGYSALDAVLSTSATQWLFSSQGPTVLDVLAAAILSCHMSQPMLRYELDKRPAILSWLERCASHTESSHVDVRALASVDKQPDPYEAGRTLAVLCWGAVFLSYTAYYSTYFRRFTRYLRNIDPASYAAPLQRLFLSSRRSTA